MLYCPKCKNEYQDGYTECADCKVSLVTYEELYPRTPLYFGSAEEMTVLDDYLKANFVKSSEVKKAKEDYIFELFVDEKELKTAQKLLKIYLHDKEVKLVKEALVKEIHANDDENPENSEQEVSLEDQQKISDMEAIRQMYEPAKLHVNSKEKADEYKSTAIMLIIVGIIGLVVDVFAFLDKLPFRFVGASKYLSCGLMALLFLVFFGFGISSLNSAKYLAKKGEREGNLSESIKAWMKENLSAEKIDELIEVYEEDDESVKFFNRSVQMKKMIKEEFTVDEALLDELIDAYYEEIFN